MDPARRRRALGVVRGADPGSDRCVFDHLAFAARTRRLRRISHEAFLGLLGQLHLADALHNFWPERGPQWDALGKTGSGSVLLVEAKAHIAELLSPPTAAGVVSRRRIEAVFDELAVRLNASPQRADWTGHFHRLASRPAHLDFLRRQRRRRLACAGRISSATRKWAGPRSAEAREAALSGGARRHGPLKAPRAVRAMSSMSIRILREQA